MESINKSWENERKGNKKIIVSQYARPRNEEIAERSQKSEDGFWSPSRNLTPSLSVHDDSNREKDVVKESVDNDVFYENSQSDSRGDDRDSAETIVSDSSHPVQTGHGPKTPSKFSYIPQNQSTAVPAAKSAIEQSDIPKIYPILDPPKLDVSKDDVASRSVPSNPQHFSKNSPAFLTNNNPNEIVAKFLNQAGDRKLTIDEVKDCFRLLETNITEDNSGKLSVDSLSTIRPVPANISPQLIEDKNPDNIKKLDRNGIIQSNRSPIKRRPLVYYGAGFSSHSMPYYRPLRRELSVTSYELSNSVPPSNSLSDLIINGNVHSVGKRGLEEDVIPPPKRHIKANGGRRLSTDKDNRKFPAQRELSNLPPYLKKQEDSGLGDMEEGEFKSKTARSIMHIINSDETAQPSKGPSMNEILNPYQLISPLKKANPLSEVRKPRRLIARALSSHKMESVKEQTAFDIIRDTMNKDEQQKASSHDPAPKRQKKDEKQTSTVPNTQILRPLDLSGNTMTHELVPRLTPSQATSQPRSTPTTTPLPHSVSTLSNHSINETSIHTTQRSHDISKPSLVVSANLNLQPATLGAPKTPEKNLSTSIRGGLFKSTSQVAPLVTIPDSKVSTEASMSAPNVTNITSIPIHSSGNISLSEVLLAPATLEQDNMKNRSENLTLRPTPTSPLSPVKRVTTIGSDPVGSKQSINTDLDIRRGTQDLLRSIVDMPVEKLPKFTFGSNRPPINIVSPDPRSDRLEAKVKVLSLEKLPKFNFENVDYSPFISVASSVSTIRQEPVTSKSWSTQGDMVSPNEWTCSKCLSTNKMNATKCIACSTDRPNGIIQSTTKNSFIMHTNSETSSSIDAEEWECKNCLKKNKAGTMKCASCEVDNPKKENNLSLQAQISQPSTAPVDNWASSGFTFGQVPGEWVCDICAIKNKADAMKCVACETDNPKKKNNIPSSSQTPQTFAASANNVPSSNQTQTSTAPANNWALSGFNFGQAPGEWVCDVCTIKNKADAMKCVACEADNPKKKNSIPSSIQTSQTSAAPINNVFSSNQTSSTSTAPVNNWSLSGFNFGQATGEWVCDICAVKNKADAMKCVACEADNPKKNNSVPSSSQTPQTSAAFVNNVFSSNQISHTSTASVNNWGFSGFNFGQAAGEWVCHICAIRNKADAMKCVACEADNPKKKNSISSSIQTSQISAAPVNDVFSSNQASHTSAAPVNNWNLSGFNFGQTTGEWVCDVCAVKNKADAVKCIACETDNPKKKNIPSSSQTSHSPAAPVNNNLTFSGFNFGQAAEWECKTCKAKNRADLVKCISCESDKPVIAWSGFSGFGTASPFGSGGSSGFGTASQFGSGGFKVPSFGNTGG